MRLCVFGASEHMGGTETYLLNLYSIIDKNRLQFDFLMHHSVGVIPYSDYIVKYGGKFYKEYYKNAEYNRPDYIGIKELFNKHPEWDGVYVNIQNIHTAYRLLVEAYKRGLQYRIIHAHSSKYSRKPKLKEKIYEEFFRLTKSRIITHFLACSEQAGKWMFRRSKFCIIPNAIDFERFRMNNQVRNDLRTIWGIKECEKVIGFCGRLVLQKNPEMLIEIFIEVQKMMPCSKLLVIGDGERRGGLEKIIEEKGIEDKVLFTGAVSNVSVYMQMMDCFVLPSRSEGFGIVLLEAQAAGLRCYTTDKVVPHETNITGRITFISQKATAKQWAEIIENRGFERCDCISELQKSEYSLESMKCKFMALFEQMNLMDRRGV